MSEGEQHSLGFFRVDRFIVPAAARSEFLEKVALSHKLLRRQTGFIRDRVVERQLPAGQTELVTIVEWGSDAVLDDIVAAVTTHHKSIGFDRQEMLSRLSIRADIGTFSVVCLP